MENKEYSGNFIVRGPKSLHKFLAEQAGREGVTLNQYVVYLLSKVSGADINAVLKSHGNQK
jgi:antitoxin HicB